MLRGYASTSTSWTPLSITAGPPAGVSAVTADFALSSVSNTTTHVPVPAPSFIQVPLWKPIRNLATYFAGPEAGVGVPGFSGSVRGGWIDQGSTTTGGQVDSFVSGASVTASGYLPVGDGVVGPAAAETWGNVGRTSSCDFATEFGVGVGAGHNLSLQGSYSWQVPGIQGPGW